MRHPEAAIHEDICKHTECIGDWKRLNSEDKRTTGWYLMVPSNGSFAVGYVPVKRDAPIEPLVYQDEASACQLLSNWSWTMLGTLP